MGMRVVKMGLYGKMKEKWEQRGGGPAERSKARLMKNLQRKEMEARRKEAFEEESYRQAGFLGRRQAIERARRPSLIGGLGGAVRSGPDWKFIGNALGIPQGKQQRQVITTAMKWAYPWLSTSTPRKHKRPRTKAGRRRQIVIRL